MKNVDTNGLDAMPVLSERELKLEQAKNAIAVSFREWMTAIQNLELSLDP